MKSAWLACLALLVTAAAVAQDGNKPVYRCPGPPVLYTDAVSAQEARDKGCRLIEGAPVTVVQMPKRPVSSTAVPAPAGTGAAGRGVEARVDPTAQRSRDTDSRRILESELKREEDALAALKKDFNNGEPERRGDERNFAKYQERVAEMRSAIGRKEADITSLKRELAKVAP